MNTDRYHQPFTFDRTVRLVISTAIIFGAVMLIKHLSGVLLSFFIACIMAYVIHPFIEFNQRLFHIRSRLLVVIVTIVEVLVALGLIGSFMGPYIMSEFADMVKMLARYTDHYVANSTIQHDIYNFIVSNIDLNQIYSQLSYQQIIDLVQEALGRLWDLMSGSINVLLSVLSWSVILLYLIFILLDYDSIMSGFRSMIPPKYRSGAMSVLGDIEMVMNRYFRGQALVSCIVGALFCIGFLIIGLPMAVVFGIFIGVLNMVPYLQLISIPIAAFLGLILSVNSGTSFWIIAAEITAVYCIVQGLQDFVITPKIMGKFMGLNPAIIFLSLSVWGSLLGFLGLVIALPLTALIISYYKRYIIDRPVAPDNTPVAEQAPLDTASAEPKE